MTIHCAVVACKIIDKLGVAYVDIIVIILIIMTVNKPLAALPAASF